MSDTPVGPGSWQASDGKWYAAEQAPWAQPPQQQQPPPQPYGAYGSSGAAMAGGPGPLATWGERVLATVIDAGISIVGFIAVAALAAVVGAVVDVLGALIGFLGYLVMTLASFYFLYMQGATGATPGKKLTGLRVLGVQTGRPIGGWLGIVRNIAHVVDALICYIGFLFPLWDEKRQTLADKIMGTVVISNQPKQPFGPEIFTI